MTTLKTAVWQTKFGLKLEDFNVKRSSWDATLVFLFFSLLGLFRRATKMQEYNSYFVVIASNQRESKFRGGLRYQITFLLKTPKM